MKFFGKISSTQGLVRKLTQMPEKVREGLADGIAEAALVVHGTAIRSIQARGSSSGNEKRYRPERIVRVSAPGNPPNSDTGDLVRSIQWSVNKTALTAKIGTNIKYGPWLEFGTLDMDARPWLGPAFLKSKKEILKILREASEKAIRKAVK